MLHNRKQQVRKVWHLKVGKKSRSNLWNLTLFSRTTCSVQIFCVPREGSVKFLFFCHYFALHFADKTFISGVKPVDETGCIVENLADKTLAGQPGRPGKGDVVSKHTWNSKKSSPEPKSTIVAQSCGAQ